MTLPFPSYDRVVYCKRIGAGVWDWGQIYSPKPKIEEIQKN